MVNKFNIDQDQFRARVEKLENLPTLPNLLNRFNEMIQDPKISMAAFAKELGKDQALTSKILKLINSAFYGFPGRISTVAHAVVLLGYDALKGLIVTSNIFDHLPEKAYPLWIHSIAVSVTSRHLAQILNLSDVEEFAVAGLLHDLGKVVMHIELEEQYGEVIEYAEKNKTSIADAEKEFFGFSHSDIGVWLAKKWTLPSKLTAAIGYHHIKDISSLPPEYADYQTRIFVVYTADKIVKSLGCTADIDIPFSENESPLHDFINLEEEQIKALVEKVAPELESLKYLKPESLK